MASKKKLIQDPDALIATQPTLFSLPGVEEKHDWFPPIRRTPEGLEELIEAADEPLGTDLEFNPKTNKPSILGVSTRAETGAVLWSEELAGRVVERAQKTNQTLVGHSVVGADRPVYEKALGIKMPLEMWDDTMILHYLCNADFCKTPGKEEDDDGGAMGLMDLWTMCSLYTDLPVWKTCRGKACSGPCPVDDVFGYCAIDSWGGLSSFHALKLDTEKKKIPWSLYRELMELSEICIQMEDYGIQVDRAYVAEMEKAFEAKKAELFPFEVINGKPVYGLFNPKSPAQVADYFRRHNVTLESTEKDQVLKVLEKEAKARKLRLEKEDGEYLFLGDVPEEMTALLRLYQFKAAGKGLKSWFDDRYVGRNGLIHPRFISTGTSTGRLSSSRPNFQNIPARGFGELVRRAVVARRGFRFLKSDYSQLELRMCLYLAGVDPRGIGKDAFSWLVGQANTVLPGAFQRAAEMMGDTERQVAKSVGHAFDYLEGFKLFSSKDLEKPNIKKEAEYGALALYRDWTFRGKIVGFTGANLAERLFGDKTLANRKKALEIQEQVFAKAFPELRKWHRKILAEVEDSREVHSAAGRYLKLYGTDEEDAKMTAAFHGQGTSADHVIGMMRRFKAETGRLPLMQVHDELDFEVPEEWADEKVKDFISLMGEETPRLPGFVSAFKAKVGSSWLEKEMVQL